MPEKLNEPKSRPGDLNPKNTVQSLAKGFRVLQAFTAEEPELKLSEVARRAGLDNGTAFRLLETLVMLGYLERFLETKQYRLTLKPLDLGFNAIARMDLRTIAQPELRTLVGEVREAASVGILDRDEVVYIERYQEGQARLGVDIRVGSRLPAYCTAIGQSILAFLPRAETRRILGLTRRVKVNDHTPVTLEEIEEKLGLPFLVTEVHLLHALRKVLEARQLVDLGPHVAFDDARCEVSSDGDSAKLVRPLDRGWAGAEADLGHRPQRH